MAQTDERLARLTALHPRVIDLSLGRIEALLAALGHPERALPPVIHVAGTNGKGSTIAFMRAALEAAGKRVHVYTSPHLVRFNERIRLAGTLVDDGALHAALDECERVNAGAPITLFEITTAAAFLLFSRAPADCLLLEVGLGGRLDATNVIDAPLVSVVTPVSFDHPEYLGTSLEGIAREKAGVIKRGRPAVLAEQEETALGVLRREAARQHAPLLIGGEDFSARAENGRLVYEDERGLLDLPAPRLGGRHQFVNAAAAIAALRTGFPDLPADAYARGMSEAQWPARLQHLTRGKLLALVPSGTDLWLDGGHNEHGGRVLADAMADLQDRASRPLILICGTLGTKDTAGFLRPFKGLAQEVLAVPVAGEHAGRAAGEVAALAASVGLASAACAGVEAALRYLSARAWPQPPRVLIAGSLYLAGAVLSANGTPVD